MNPHVSLILSAKCISCSSSYIYLENLEVFEMPVNWGCFSLIVSSLADDGNAHSVLQQQHICASWVVLHFFGLSLSEYQTSSSFSLLQNVGGEGNDLGPENCWWRNCCLCGSQLLVHFWQPCFVLKSPSIIWSSSDGSKVFGDVIILGHCDIVPTRKGTT
jgi:hypothetical protein